MFGKFYFYNLWYLTIQERGGGASSLTINQLMIRLHCVKVKVSSRKTSQDDKIIQRFRNY